MKPGRLASIALAIIFLPMAVPAHAATIEITMENLVISPTEVSA
jgi:cell division septation protein DedD